MCKCLDCGVPATQKELMRLADKVLELMGENARLKEALRVEQAITAAALRDVGETMKDNISGGLRTGSLGYSTGTGDTAWTTPTFTTSSTYRR